MKIDFTKMNGCGNDFVIIDDRGQSINLNQEQIIKLADRSNDKTQGCDQVIVLELPTSKEANIFMRIYNPDGSEAQACGNATRCVVDLLRKEYRSIRIQTIERILDCEINSAGTILVNMGKVVSYKEEIDLGSEYKGFPKPAFVNVGNPHCIFIVPNSEEVNLEYWGPKIENHPCFPERTNVEFVSQLADHLFCVRVWERGAGITKACGSGAAAVAWALKESSLTKIDNIVDMEMEGGSITIRIRDNGDIIMNGEIKPEFASSIEL